jgi:hypothetical protein
MTATYTETRKRNTIVRTFIPDDDVPEWVGDVAAYRAAHGMPTPEPVTIVVKLDKPRKHGEHGNPVRRVKKSAPAWVRCWDGHREDDIPDCVPGCYLK